MNGNSKKSGKTDNVALKAGTWYVISTVMVKTITVITTPIFTRLLTTEEYGTVSTFTSWYSIFFVCCSLNLTYSIGRAKLDFEGKLDDYIGSMQLLSLLVTLVFAGIAAIFLRPFSGFLGLSESMTVCLLVYLVFSPAISFVQNGYRYRYQYRQNIWIAWYTVLASTGLSLLLVWYGNGEKDFLRVLGTVLPAMLLSCFFWGRMLAGHRIHANREFWSYGIKISLPLVVHTISLNILSHSDRIFINKICGANDTGIYSLAYSYGVILSTITNAVSEGWLPWFHDNYYLGNYKDIRKNVKLIVILGCYVGVACIALAPEAVLILGGENYSDGVYCVPPIVLGIVCQYIYTHYVNIELHLKKTSYVSLGTIIAAIINIVLNIILIPRFGYVAAAYTTFVSYLALMFIHYFVTKKILKVNLYNDLFMFGALGITALCSSIIVVTYQHTLIRYGMVIIGFLSFLWVFRGFIISFLKKVCRR